ncbi:hypothetical protein LO772_03880 [Yinghuangia sp. ASG 101]|uniref:hypothetical protein n=1 Tax=Yinghuangia sp. ASG 101 TaxID=2896848 RepID=UPI001E319B93|nr:hypothetical protein [Yinghuangia sp. ASG 101]UGQ12772.1 hypothetical protein LO772_03880 [Yinghuangia sp. ASG 101]
MARPGDWSALGLGSDPTPGDADRLDRVTTSQNDLIDLAKTINSGLDEVMKTTDGVFVGKTAEALRKIIDERLRNYIATFKTAHENVRGALITYTGVMREQQRRADAALTAAAALPEDDEDGRAAHKATAEDAKSILETAASTLETVLSEASTSIASPVDECEEFWKALGWIAIILIIPAIIFGGPLALLSLALNVALMIKAAVDFAQGKGSVTALVLGILGVIAPTTKGINLGNLWKGIKGISGKGFAGTKNFFTGGADSFGLFWRLSLGIDDAFMASGSWFAGSLKNLRFGPGLGNFGGAGSLGALKFFPLGAEMTVINVAGAKMFFGLRSVITGLNGIKAFGSWVANGLSGFKGLRLFLPVAADEMGEGLALAFRIGFIDRGIFGMYRYGAFANGKFIGMGSKISGVAGGGFSAFGPGANGMDLATVGGAGFKNLDLNSGTLIGPMNFGNFTPHVNLGGLNGGPRLGAFGTVHPGGALTTMPSPHVAFTPGSMSVNFPTITMPSLTVFFGEKGGNLAGVFNVPGTSAQITDLPVLGSPAVNLANLGGLTTFNPTGAMNFDMSGLGSIPQSLGHVNLTGVANGTPAVAPGLTQLPDVNTHIVDTPSALSLSLPQHQPGLGSLGASDMPTLTGGEITTPAHADLTGLTTRPVAMPSAGDLSMAGLGGVGHVSLPQLNANLMPTATPQVTPGGAPAVNTAPAVDLNARPGPATSLTADSLGMLPNANASVVDMPALGHVGLTATPPHATISGALVNVHGIAPAPPAQVAHTGSTDATPSVGTHGTPVTLDQVSAMVNDLLGSIKPADTAAPPSVQGLGTHLTGGGHTPGYPPGRTDDLLPGPQHHQRFPLIMVQQGATLDMQHTFSSIPGLDGVRVAVSPSLTPGRFLDIDVTGGAAATHNLRVSHVAITAGGAIGGSGAAAANGMDVLRIERTLPGGAIERWDYHLSAADHHRLLDHQTIDAQVTGPNPAQAFALDTYATDSVHPHPAGGSSAAPPPAPATTSPAPPPPPPPHAFDIPGLHGARVEVRFADGDARIGALRSTGGPGTPPIHVRTVRSPDGTDLVRVEHDVIHGVEIRRWDFTVDGSGHQLVTIERQFNLADGHFPGTSVRFDVDRADNVLGDVRHVDGTGHALAVAGGNPIHVNNAGVAVPTPSGFQLFDPATGRAIADGLRLADHTGPSDVFVLTPRGGGGLTLVDSTALVARGTVTMPPSATPVYHVHVTGAAPRVAVHSAQGVFSHHALPAAVTNLPGGFVRLPDGGGGLPQLAHADGTVVPGSTVTGQLDHTGAINGYRIEHPAGHHIVDNAGVHTHDVTTLTGGPHAGTRVFAPPGAPHTPLPHPRDGVGVPDTTLTVHHVAGTLHVGAPGTGPRVAVHTGAGAFSHHALPITAHNVPGGFVRLPDGGGGLPQLAHADGTVVPGSTVTGQLDHTGAINGHRIDHPAVGAAPARHFVVDNAGAHTHDVTTLTGGPHANSHVFTPPANPNNPLPHPHAADGTPDTTLAVTRVGNEIRLTDAHQAIHVYGNGGAYRHTFIPVQGAPIGPHHIRTNATGTALVTQTFGNVPGAHATPLTGRPGGGFRIEHGGHHFVVGAHGDVTHTVVALRGADGHATGQLVLTPYHAHAPAGAAAGGPTVHALNGTPSPHTAVVRPDGSLEITGTTAVTRYRWDGSFEFRVTRLADGHGTPIAQNVRVHAGGAHELVDANLARINGMAVTPRPGGGFRVADANGGFRLFDGHRNLAFTVTPAAAGGGVFHVADNTGTHLYDMVRLSDSTGFSDAAQIRHLETTPGNLRLRDGDLAIANGTVHVRTDGNPGYRVDGPGGLRQDEFKLYSASGTIEFQRINIVHKGGIVAHRHFEVTYPAGGTATWKVAKSDAHGNPIVTPAGTEKWFDGGVVDMKGLGAGRVHLTGHAKATIFERRTLPGGNLLDAHHDPSIVGEFHFLNQRGVWSEFHPNGTLAQHGRRNWGESTRAYFDVATVNGLDKRVRHFQTNPDGGHVLTPLRNLPFTQSFGSGTWHRFDGQFREIAQGTRTWGPGRGWTDTMDHPITGQSVVVHEKFGRFQLSMHDVRRYTALDFDAQGLPGPGYKAVTPEGKVQGSGETLKNGDGFLTVQRFAEQRPPTSYRWLMSEHVRNTDMSRFRWFGNDSRLQVATWDVTGPGGISDSGVRFTTMVKSTFDINYAGDLVREVRALPSGNTLKMGDVALPNGVARQADYRPFSEGAGNPRGHRTFHAPDFVAPHGINRNRIIWQDRVNTNLADPDWYSPAAGTNWHVVRTGLDDGSVIDYRPTPAVRPGAAAVNGTAVSRHNWHAGNGDWTRFDHQGNVIGRTDTWPDPGGAGLVRIEQFHNPAGKLRWRDAGTPANTGARITNVNRDITPWGFDRESFQDFGADGRLIRDHRALAGGTSVDAWMVSRDPVSGAEVWQWNKIDRHGNIMEFGTGGPDRVRHWFDADNNLLTRWEPAARWSDDIASMHHVSVQQIPPRPEHGAIRGTFTDAPWRVREFAKTPNDAINPHIWREFDNNMVVKDKIRLTNSTFLESSHWNGHWRQYAPDGVTVTTDRSIAGYISDIAPDGTRGLAGRETNFVDILNEYRGFGRMGREANRWDWGPSVDGVAAEAPYIQKGLQALAIEFGQEWLLDFVMNLVVFGIVSGVTGTPFTGMDVLRAMFGATMSAGVKSGISAAHMLSKRGGPWKLHAGNADDGKPGGFRPDDHTWNNEFGGFERVQRWRVGTYDYAVTTVIGGTLSAFLNGSAGSAIFGIKDKDGNTVKLHGTDALLAGLGYALGGMINGLSVAAARTLVQQNVVGRWIHRQGPVDIFVLGGLGKMAEKSFTNLFMNPQVLNWTLPDIRNGAPPEPPPPSTGATP